MMQKDFSKNSDGSQIQIELSDKPVTSHGSMVILSRFLEKLKIKELLVRVLPHQRTSTDASTAGEIALALIAAVSAGACRFAYAAVIWSITGWLLWLPSL